MLVNEKLTSRANLFYMYKLFAFTCTTVCSGTINLQCLRLFAAEGPNRFGSKRVLRFSSRRDSSMIDITSYDNTVIAS